MREFLPLVIALPLLGSLGLMLGAGRLKDRPSASSPNRPCLAIATE